VPPAICQHASRARYLEVSGLAQRAQSRGVAQVMDPRVDAGIDPFALVGTDAVIGDRVALTSEFSPAAQSWGFASIVL
jgi:hypothetical protein